MLLLFLVLCVSSAIAQSELDTLWSRSYDLSGQIYKLVETADFGYASTGWKYNNETSSVDIHFAKYDYWGRLSFERLYGDSLQDRGMALATCPDGDLLICGTRINGSDFSVYAQKVSQTGDSLWFRSYPVAAEGTVVDVEVDPDGSFVIAFSAGPAGSTSCYLTKADANGNFLWQEEFDQLRGASGILIKGIVSDGNGGYLLAGYAHESPHWPTYTVVLDVSSDGAYIDGRAFGLTALSGSNDITQTSDGGFALCGYSGEGSYPELHVTKLNSDLSTEWMTSYPAPAYRYGLSIIESATGNLCAMGYTRTTESVRWDYLLYLIDPDGVPIDSAIYGVEGWDRPANIICAQDGGFVFGGYSESFGDQPQLDWIYKTVPDTILFSPAHEALAPANRALSIFPNPFNNLAHFEFTLSSTSHARLVVFNVLGRQVAKLADGTLTAGTHTVQLNGEDLSSGIYFVSLITPTSVSSEKIVLLK